MAESERRSYGIAFGRSPVCTNDRSGGAASEKSPFLLGAASKADRAFCATMMNDLLIWLSVCGVALAILAMLSFV